MVFSFNDSSETMDAAARPAVGEEYRTLSLFMPHFSIDFGSYYLGELYVCMGGVKYYERRFIFFTPSSGRDFNNVPKKCLSDFLSEFPADGASFPLDGDGQRIIVSMVTSPDYQDGQLAKFLKDNPGFLTAHAAR